MRAGRAAQGALVAALATSAGACGLSTSGLAGSGDGGSIAPLDASPSDAVSEIDGGDTPDAPLDAAIADATSFDAPVEAGCAPFDAGLGGPLALATFILRGAAAYNENNDARITLNNSNNDEKGAAWWPTQLPANVGGYDLTFKFRVGPNQTPGDGIAFAVLEAPTAPDVGDSGDGVGLRNIPGGAGVPSGYAVVVDLYQTMGDPTDLAQTTLKLVTMPAFQVVAKVAVPYRFDDGKEYPVDVSWRAPSTLTATIHTPASTTINVGSVDPGLTTKAPAFFGFTAATGGGSDSHNEIASATIGGLCK